MRINMVWLCILWRFCCWLNRSCRPTSSCYFRVNFLFIRIRNFCVILTLNTILLNMMMIILKCIVLSLINNLHAVSSPFLQQFRSLESPNPLLRFFLLVTFSKDNFLPILFINIKTEIVEFAIPKDVMIDRIISEVLIALLIVTSTVS